MLLLTIDLVAGRELADTGVEMEFDLSHDWSAASDQGKAQAGTARGWTATNRCSAQTSNNCFLFIEWIIESGIIRRV